MRYEVNFRYRAPGSSDSREAKTQVSAPNKNGALFMSGYQACQLGIDPMTLEAIVVSPVKESEPASGKETREKAG